MELLSNALNETVSDLLGDILIIQKNWGKLSSVKDHAFPYRLKNKILYVAVDHPLWKQELKARAPQIISLISKETGIEIERLKIELNPAFFKKPPRINPKREKIREKITPEELIEVLSRLNGDFISQRLKHIYEKSKKQEEK